MFSIWHPILAWLPVWEDILNKGSKRGNRTDTKTNQRNCETLGIREPAGHRMAVYARRGVGPDCGRVEGRREGEEMTSQKKAVSPHPWPKGKPFLDKSDFLTDHFYRMHLHKQKNLSVREGLDCLECGIALTNQGDYLCQECRDFEFPPLSENALAP